MLVPSINKPVHYVGNTNALITLVIYEDYECEYCGKAHEDLTQLRQRYKENIFFIYKNFPLSFHPHALLAARVAEACALQDKFIQAHDLIFQYQEFLEYGVDGILRLLEKKYAISIKKLNEDLKKEEVKKKVVNDIENGLRRNIKTTPAIFINGTRYTGRVEFEEMYKQVEGVLC